MNIKGVIFDFGGVISTGQEQRHVEAILRLLGISDAVEFHRVYMEHRLGYDGGSMSAEAFWGRVIDHFGCKRPPLDRLIELDVGSWTQINGDTLDFAARLRENGIATAVLSNMNIDALALINREFSWIHDFDPLVYSCDLGLCKPDRRIYEICVSRMGLKPQECLFLDDGPGNVAAAVDFGIRAMVFEGKESLDIIKQCYFCNIYADKMTQ